VTTGVAAVLVDNTWAAGMVSGGGARLEKTVVELKFHVKTINKIPLFSS
jgi:hypothetical protein